MPGGAATRHMVNAAVLRELGPGGYLVTVSYTHLLTNRHYVASCVSAMYCFIGQDRSAVATLSYRW